MSNISQNTDVLSSMVTITTGQSNITIKLFVLQSQCMYI